MVRRSATALRRTARRLGTQPVGPRVAPGIRRRAAGIGRGAQSMLNARDVRAGLTVLLVLIWGVDLGLRTVERSVTKWRAVEVG